MPNQGLIFNLFINLVAQIIEEMCAPSSVVNQPLRDATVNPNEDADTLSDPVSTHEITTESIPTLEPFFINIKVVVYAALSGMISFLPDGSIHGCNNQFSTMLFGYSQEELLKKVSIVYLVQI